MKKKIKKFIKLTKNFGIKLSTSLLFSNLSKRDNLYIEKIKQYLKNQFTNILTEATKYEVSLNKNNAKQKIWTFWWQGKENLPEILKLCLESQKKFIDMSKYEYVFITKDNYSEYVDIPNYIIEKMDKGIISITHFSDLLRVSLLDKYGGAWIDLTMLITKPIPSEIFDYPFYSINLVNTNHLPSGIGQKVTNCRWASFLYSSSGPNNPVFKYLKNAVLEYWKKYDYPIDYFFMNFFLQIGYECIPEIKKEIDLVPINNVDLYKLQPLINNFTSNNVEEIINSTTCFYKLTQKKPAYKFIENKKTLFGVLWDYYEVKND